MSDTNRGLDLSNIGTASEGEKQDFRKFYDRMLGRPHPGLEFYLNNVPDAMKRYRAFADAATPRNLDTDRRVTSFGFLTYYALTGYVEGVRYLVYIMQQLGLTQAQVMEGLTIAFLHAGPRGSETIATALEEFPWTVPPTQAQLGHSVRALTSRTRSSPPRSCECSRSGTSERWGRSRRTCGSPRATTRCC